MTLFQLNTPDKGQSTTKEVRSAHAHPYYAIPLWQYNKPLTTLILPRAVIKETLGQGEQQKGHTTIKTVNTVNTPKPRPIALLVHLVETFVPVTSPSTLYRIDIIILRQCHRNVNPGYHSPSLDPTRLLPRNRKKLLLPHLLSRTRSQLPIG